MSKYLIAHIIVGAMVIALIGIAVWAVYATLALAEKTLPAVITGSATVLVAVLAHYLSRWREQELRQQQLRQENYRQILELIAPFVREEAGGRDKLDTAHLLSWVVGSPEVIAATQTFTEQRSIGNLNAVLAAMRQDLGVLKIDKPLALAVFPPQARVEHLPGLTPLAAPPAA